MIKLFLATPCSMWDLNSLTRDRTHASCIINAASQPLDRKSQEDYTLKLAKVLKGRSCSRKREDLPLFCARAVVVEAFSAEHMRTRV